MHRYQFKPFFKHSLPVAPGAAARAEQALPYQITTLCRIESVADVERLIRQCLFGIQGAAPAISHEPQGQGKLTRIAVQIRCTVPERASLVRLVSRLGLEKSVRSVCWQSMPGRLN
ncbi:hypothetical protein [Undibacterium sp.]|uniref:hypothetical protein n=1 Tax=Undibacterium sp. TaxID=1914977 RepID=UPI002CE67B87|nr:hypothetical protein [Undibacterium sp.]HTD05577.1 hypothetical protein [Undibacterium sp.]